MRLISCLFFACLLSFFNYVHGQELESANTRSLNDQFDELMSTSQTYNLYKAVKEEKLVTFEKALGDTLITKNEAIADGIARIKVLNTQIEEQDKGLAALEEELQVSKSKSDGIEFFGSLILKKNFVIIFWLVTSVLLIALLVALFLFKQSNIVTVRSVKALEEAEESLKTLRHNALEREMKLKRELQTERNKLTELDYKKTSA